MQDAFAKGTASKTFDFAEEAGIVGVEDLMAKLKTDVERLRKQGRELAGDDIIQSDISALNAKGLDDDDLQDILEETTDTRAKRQDLQNSRQKKLSAALRRQRVEELKKKGSSLATPVYHRFHPIIRSNSEAAS